MARNSSVRNASAPVEHSGPALENFVGVLVASVGLIDALRDTGERTDR